MTPNELKNKVLEEFDAANLLTSLELQDSSFGELPRLFESSHFSIRITLNDQAAMAAASTVAARLKSDLQLLGVELEYAIDTQWKISQFFPDVCRRSEDGGWIPAETFDLELKSGSVKRLVAVRVSKAATCEIRRYLSRVPLPDQQNAICRLLETWAREQLECGGLTHWNPVLYPTRTVRAQDVARIIQQQEQPDLQPHLS